MDAKKGDVVLEVCCEASVENVVNAFKGGAIRVELCAALGEGGTTPSIGAVVSVVREVSRKKMKGDISKKCEIHVMIRPRGGDFVYSSDEVRTMIANIKAMKRAGCDGVVFGCLEEDGSICVEVLKRLVKSSKPELQVTFHRAFDMCESRLKSLSILIENGVDRVLTSGGEDDAMSGHTCIANLVKHANGLIVIAAGAGVKHDNVSQLIALTHVSHLHASSACMKRVESKMKFRNKRVTMGRSSQEYTRKIVSEERVRELISKIQFEQMDELSDNLEMLVKSLNLLPGTKKK